MEILEKQLQSRHKEQPTKQEDGTSEPTVISRRQAELVEANERLQRTAQVTSNFANNVYLLRHPTYFCLLNILAEFLVGMEIVSQIRDEDQAASDCARGKELEDLLLKTQGGLVLYANSAIDETTVERSC
ncbi:hypothetical protein GQ600_10454 [Phytophthora cactorum]|nr:hypothetical protein GQ600_10454 [Phytophthora cactorum]